MGKATRAQADIRVETVIRLIGEGHSSPAILQFCAEKWGLKERQARSYVARARQKMMETWDRDRNDVLAEQLQRFETVYRKAIKTENLPCAIAALNAVSKLCRLEG